jgi:hypothetical protein
MLYTIKEEDTQVFQADQLKLCEYQYIRDMLQEPDSLGNKPTLQKIVEDSLRYCPMVDTSKHNKRGKQTKRI